MTERKMNEEAKKYIERLKKKGFNCFSCFQCPHAMDAPEPFKGFKTGIPDTEFFNQVEKAFINGARYGYCSNYNEWFVDKFPEDENDILCMIGKDEFVVGYYHTKNKRYYTIDGKEISVIAWQVIKKAPILL